ncbi:hypothetical protein KAR91_33130 [Candidatus Pacearchaeota archaeon]|nr:hypothetical protein [Candidatus Pacearchaeota archaeon]
MEHCTEFEELFIGLNRSYGQWYKTNKAETIKATVTRGNYFKHLDGEIGLGLVPIREDNTCIWGAIDVDAHGDLPDIDLNELEKKIANLNLPLVTCRSKSGGAHLYLFMEEPISAKQMQQTLKKWAGVLGHGGVEIFPKQVKLSEGQLGNWLNLPYFNAKDTVRYAIKNGNKLTLEQFCIEAMSVRQTWKFIKSINITLFTTSEMEGAPPCLIHLAESGIKEGCRNEAMFNFGIYFHKMGGDWVDEMLALNYSKQIMPKALSKREIDTLCGSIERAGTYLYKCSQPPIVDFCNKELCKKQKYGIQALGGNYNDFIVGNLTKVLSDPPRWILEINEEPIELATEELMTFRYLRRAIIEKLSAVIPPMKDEDWLLYLKPKMENHIVIEAPDDASVKGQIKAMLDDFASQTDRIEKFDMLDMNRGIPIWKKGEILFRSQDFITFMKRRKAEDAKGAKLWSILRSCGCSHKSARIGESVKQVWVYPYKRQSAQFRDPIKDQKEEF